MRATLLRLLLIMDHSLSGGKGIQVQTASSVITCKPHSMSMLSRSSDQLDLNSPTPKYGAATYLLTSLMLSQKCIHILTGLERTLVKLLVQSYQMMLKGCRNCLSKRKQVLEAISH